MSDINRLQLLYKFFYSITFYLFLINLWISLLSEARDLDLTNVTVYD